MLYATNAALSVSCPNLSGREMEHPWMCSQAASQHVSKGVIKFGVFSSCLVLFKILRLLHPTAI